jgi:hypothetical protein
MQHNVKVVKFIGSVGVQSPRNPAEQVVEEQARRGGVHEIHLQAVPQVPSRVCAFKMMCDDRMMRHDSHKA